MKDPQQRKVLQKLRAKWKFDFMRKALEAFQRIKEVMKSQTKEAEVRYDYHVVRKTLRSLINYFQLKRLSYSMAYHHGMRTIVRACFKDWTKFRIIALKQRKLAAGLYAGDDDDLIIAPLEMFNSIGALKASEEGSKAPHEAAKRSKTLSSLPSSQVDPAHTSKRKGTT
mmetsp:Transcript_41288/g.129732  ORF Transcript_41288/g.129732 Transcript_41288/m.129732 type:complete len:169 (+) Transcript_41288:2904-3410(+)